MKQITFAPRNHLLTNTNTWTPDSQWLVFDVRPSGASFTGETIERVNIHTGEVEVIYRASQGAYVGVVTVHPKSEKYVFIHGPENPDETWYYDFHHRRGVIVESGKVSNLDAMDITAPYTPGALRGGSHVHVFSPNGERVSFTYNDHVMHELDPALDLRNVGVAAPFGPVNVQKQHPREYSGSHWCVLVSKTTPTPQPGSDEINRAYEEGWVGNHALAFIGDTLSFGPVNVQKQHPREYSGSHWCVLVSKTTPTPQPGSDEINRAYEEGWVGDHALAFIGDTLSPKGEKVPELFIVELPQDEAGWKDG